MVPIVAYNYGAKKPDRVKKTIKLAIFSAVAIMAVGLAAFELAPGALLSLFDASENMLAIGTPACGSSPSPFSSPGPALSSAPPFNPWAAAAGLFWWPCCARSCSCSPPLPFCWP